MTELDKYRLSITAAHLQSEAEVLQGLQRTAGISDTLRSSAYSTAVQLVEEIRADDNPGLMEIFLAEYGLSTDEGVALMCLAEALLRVPDSATIDALIEDKIAPSDWGAHLGQSSSSLVNASTWALMLTGTVLQENESGVASVLRGAIKRVGEPVIRLAVRSAMKEMGSQFVLGESIEEAIERGQGKADAGFTFSYDMLGEAALTQKDADAFFTAYSDAIDQLSPGCSSDNIKLNPGISVKLSALHPRYEETQRTRVMSELVPRMLVLAKKAKSAGMGLNIDAEEADRLELSLDVIEAVFADQSLQDWDGFGVVVQAYGKRALPVIDWLHALALAYDRQIMVRLVKGAYWDSEIKRAQVEGLTGFPVFTRKAATDVSYLCCASKLLQMTDRLYPQFATHNAHTIAMILEMQPDPQQFEFQRLHGMGEALHDIVHQQHAVACRIYAPVGAHRDLLAYLVRRLLENGANSSFVNQIVDQDTPVEVVAADPFATVSLGMQNPSVIRPADLFQPERINSSGIDLHDPAALLAFEKARQPFREQQWSAAPLGAASLGGALREEVRNPADRADIVGTITLASPDAVLAAVGASKPWSALPSERAVVLNRVADLFEMHKGELFSLLAREAGKTPNDVVAELREAVDFLRYYAARTLRLSARPLGRIACISPWNFPLAIFTGQISAALAVGNAVLAKPAESTPLVAARAVALMHKAGVPLSALHLLPGSGTEIGAALVSHARIDGVAFTGSTATAKMINKSLAANASPGAPLIAETGGLNAMIVDSSALPEQAVTDIIVSSFQSAGQRCSALRMLYLQKDVAEPLLEMLCGAMDELVVGDPWLASTDVGPVIDEQARAGILEYIAAAHAEARVIHQVQAPEHGLFVPPAMIRLTGIEALEREVFGPVLHVATYAASDLHTVIESINAKGYGLTFGLHTRIDSRVQEVVDGVHAGNLYVNRNQIGAVVGSQPFGGEGLSGTGPKAGGPLYLPRFARIGKKTESGTWLQACDLAKLRQHIEASSRRSLIERQELPGPTGESNTLSILSRGPLLCLGPGEQAMTLQMGKIETLGGVAVGSQGYLAADQLSSLEGISGVVYWGDDAGAIASALAAREGAIIPLITGIPDRGHVACEKHLCIDTTAAGGNAQLLAS